MKILYVPWRKKYAQDVNIKNECAEKKNCPFCTAFADNNDAKNYIIKRYNHNVLILNLYPYNAGHMMVIPYTHTSNIHELSPEARAEMVEIMSQASQVAQEKLGAHGVNIGMNLGKEAGAGIPSHIHLHVLPRWKGDTNFMPLLANTKTISFDLNEIYADLKKYF